jgi:hypothetical protein
MVAVAKTPGIAAGVGPEERRTPIAMGLRYATQFGDGSPFKSSDAYERMLLNAARGDQALSLLLTTHHSLLTTHHSPLTTHHSPLTTHH